MIKIFGIRHHGPGSAKALMVALEQMKPDCLLVELPHDAGALLPDIRNEALQPPVAILLFHPKELQQASYYPFAVFSPEWQAVRYALRNGIPVEAIDLPMNLGFSLQETLPETGQLALLPETEKNEEALRAQVDPLGFMAEIAGYSDSERWWEATFEQQENQADIFDAILEMIRALRMEFPRQESRQTLIREAYMRKMIRKAVRDGCQRIAVVCGAWHAPVLEAYEDYPAGNDLALLRGIKKTPTIATWIPWSYDRLAFRSGYAAGVISPAWYELLFSHSSAVSIHWMVGVARLFREEDLEVSSAHVQEAVRLADTLAVLRNRTIAGIDELREAAVSVFCHGDQEAFGLIENRLIVGDKRGSIPPEIPTVPLLRDLEKAIRSARLIQAYQHPGEVLKKLDLRKESNLYASILLHRLLVLQVPWGQLQERSELAQGRFAETWKLKWHPEFSFRLMEAGIWGTTIEEACVRFLLQNTRDIDHLGVLTRLLEEALKADLGEAVPFVVQRLREMAALSQDIHHLMDALPSLVSIIRYGDTRKTDIEAVKHIVYEVIPRINIGLPGASVGIEEEVARELFGQLWSVNRAIGLLADDQYRKEWERTLRQLVQLEKAHQLIRGGATRLLLDKGLLTVEDTNRAMHFALSSADDPAHFANWLEGFLSGSGLLLVHHPELWTVVDQWVSGLPPAYFEETLPLLRRSFSRFSAAERQKIFQMVLQGPSMEQAQGAAGNFEENRARKMLPVLKTLLGKVERGEVQI